MPNDKYVEEQSHELQEIAHKIFLEAMLLPEQFQIVIVIDKLLFAWKDFKNILRHKTM